MKYHLVQLGCQMNISDGERIASVLKTMGAEPTDDEAEADLLGVVACSVRQKAIDRVYSTIHHWNQMKDEKNILTFATGCILPEDREKFLERFDFVFPVEEISTLPTLISGYGVASRFSVAAERSSFVQLAGSPRTVPVEDFWRLAPQHSSAFSAFVPIQNGCDKFCSFCAVPYTRGRELSRPAEAVLREVEELVAKGYKTITLLGQNVNSYGLDKKGSELSFARLLDEVGTIADASAEGTWIYYTAPHPRDMGVDVLEVMAKHHSLAKQIHLPLQSGDDKVLIRMNRKHDVGRYRDLVRNIREILPEASLFTDIIVGFSGETEEQFKSTEAAMEEFGYAMAYIALYSPRPGAQSSRWEDDVPLEVKKERFRLLSEILKKTAHEFGSAYVGRRIPVLLEGFDRKGTYLVGHNEQKISVRCPIPAGAELVALGLGEAADAVGKFGLIEIVTQNGLSMEGRLVELSPALGALAANLA